MDGRRKARVEGTDGSDFTHRQTIDKRYTILAAAKNFIRIGGIITLIIAVITLSSSFLLPSLNGLGIGGNIPIYVHAALAFVVFFLSQIVSTNVVDESIVSLHLLCAVFLSAVSVFVAIGAFTVVVKDNAPVIAIVVGLINLFLALLSYKGHKADNDIISSIKKTA